MAEPFPERRTEPRLLCADLMQVEWTDANGSLLTACANLEDISPSGGCVQVDQAVPANTVVRLTCEHAEWTARVKYCVFRETGYFLGLQFEPGVYWSEIEFQPKHLLDPQDLVRLAAAEDPEARPSPEHN
ncbi:MAG TPA: hypothetical protein VN428_02900 [Bryobacteraceae bacterium]|nr:hypothetical protein [Bryobacteraceae bacterium]